MSRLRGRAAALVPVLLALVTVASCKGGDDGGKTAANEPDATGTLKQAAQAMSALSSTAFTLTTDGNPQIVVKGGEMRLLKNGDADGTLQIAQSGQAVEMKIVSLGPTFYVKAVTGGWKKVPKAMAASLYDPSAVLDPNRGIPKLLTSVTDPKAEASEDVRGQKAHRVAATLPKEALNGLIPGVNEDLKGKVWISDADHRLLRVKGNVSGGSLTIDFTEFDKPYKITAPA
ncbi:LppX_LprAFG lipoprotein [Actinomadura atramentaria]|uniref:LppX_LprAFG lipoprotein n=1 Tax=Actinomadura atramentaria TaxID=1990 RepID=UPI000362DD69|nr:LppX_LprAFG lipoprotein [Actinomadura atramentaria]